MQCHLYFIYNTYADKKVIQFLKNIKIMDFKTKTLSLYISDYLKKYITYCTVSFLLFIVKIYFFIKII